MLSQTRLVQTRLTRALVALSLLGIGGCSRQATISGKVTYQGHPVTFGSVIFLNEDQTARSCAIAADGTYRVEGVHRGLARVAVISPDPAKNKASRLSGAGISSAAAEKRMREWTPLPRHFDNPKGSGLSCQVTGASVTYDIKLK